MIKGNLKNKKSLVTAMGFVILIGIILAVNFGNAVDVDVTEVKKGEINEYIELQGKIDLSKKETVYSKITGLVDEVIASEGDNISSGAGLLRLNAENLDFAKRKAQSGYDAAKANVEVLKKSVKPEQIKLAQAQLVQMKAAFQMAQEDYTYQKNNENNENNAQALFKSGTIAKQDLDDAVLALANAESTLKNAQQNINIAQYNLDITQKGVSNDEIKAAMANAEAAKILVEELNNNMGKTTVVSPIDGIVLSKFIEKGQEVQPGISLYEIGDNDTAYVRVDVMVDDMSKVKLNQKAIIKGDILDDKTIEGKVYYIAPKAESKISSLGVEQQRIEVRIMFNNSIVELKPGYSVDVDIITKVEPSTLYVADKTLFELDGKDQVFVIKNNKLELREVKKGIENNDYIEIEKGLAEGEEIVMDPATNLKPGMRVK